MSGVIGIGLLGAGTIGSGVIKLFKENAQEISQRLGKDLVIKRVLERHPERVTSLGLSPDLVTDNFQEILSDPEIEIVVELLGGIEPARSFIIAALESGKHVVTANKDVVAAHGKELFEAAASGNAEFYFEAAVGGGIPVIRVLKESLSANQMRQVIGIVNGTTNYILTRMSQEQIDFATALSEAQGAGYAESDPSADVDGIDAARKIAILASIAFNSRVTPDRVFVEGIRRISLEDLHYAQEFGYVIKLLAIAREDSEEIEVRVHPTLIPATHPLAAVQGVFNAIYISGNAVGETMFYGQGAGQMPTASAVVGDIMEIVRNVGSSSKGLSCTCYLERKIRPVGEIISKYYVRLIVADCPGVLATIAGVFGKHQVGLATVIQKRTLNTSKGMMAEIVMITHQVKEQYIQDALATIRELPVVDSVENVIRVEGGN